MPGTFLVVEALATRIPPPVTPLLLYHAQPARGLRGKILWAKGNVGLSVKDFGRAEQLDPQHGEVQGFVNSLRNNASDFFREALRDIARGDYETAVASLTTALQVAPEDVKALVIRAAALRCVLA
jgi:tetratricopeptide (TPR) repeat protein